MHQTATWDLLNVDDPTFETSHLFNPVPTYANRQTVEVGELVKIAVRREGKQGGRWMVIEHRRETPSGPVYLGRYSPNATRPAPLDTPTIEFTTDHIYRMEPRVFILWGHAGTPLAMRGYHPGQELMRPVDHEEQPLSNCSEIVYRFEAFGRERAQEQYQQLRRTQPHWPEYEELN